MKVFIRAIAVQVVPNILEFANNFLPLVAERVIKNLGTRWIFFSAFVPLVVDGIKGFANRSLYFFEKTRLLKFAQVLTPSFSALAKLTTVALRALTLASRWWGRWTW